MNSGRLLAHFERVADAPEAIPRLRRFILDLAVRGRLVEQSSNDEPASELLERIKTEKDKGSRPGQMKKQESLLPVRPDEIRFDSPPSWSWVRLGTIAYVIMGQSPPGTTYNKTGEGIPLINGPVEFTEGPFGKTLVNQYTTAPTNLCDQGDLLLCVRGSTTGRTNVAGFPACIGRGVAAIRPILGNRYVHLFIWRLRAEIIAMGRGIAFPSVSRRQIEGLPVPLPPLAEQHRIIARVDELMMLCDQLEAAQTERERRRDRLAAASLHRLNNGAAAEAFREHARFTLDHLPRLTTRPEHVPALRQTILYLAVRGKLVAQDPDDEPASELLRRVGAETAPRVKAGKIKKQEPTPPVVEAKPFPLPGMWTWTRLGQIGDWASGSTPSRGNHDFFGGGIAWLKSGELNDNQQLTGSEETVTDLALSMCSFRQNQPGDVLIAMYGATIGKLAILAEPAVTNQAVCGCTPSFGVFNRYLFYFLLSQRTQFHSASEGGAQPNISKAKIVDFAFPLPPLAEQHRIVAKVDELMALCERLEAQLANSRTESRLLLEALLHEALGAAA